MPAMRWSQAMNWPLCRKTWIGDCGAFAVGSADGLPGRRFYSRWLTYSPVKKILISRRREERWCRAPGPCNLPDQGRPRHCDRLEDHHDFLDRLGVHEIIDYTPPDVAQDVLAWMWCWTSGPAMLVGVL